MHTQACQTGQGFRGRKLLKLSWQLAARLGLHVLLMHLKRVASAMQLFHWSLVARLLLRRGYPGLTQLEKHRH